MEEAMGILKGVFHSYADNGPASLVLEMQAKSDVRKTRGFKKLSHYPTKFREIGPARGYEHTTWVGPLTSTALHH